MTGSEPARIATLGGLVAGLALSAFVSLPGPPVAIALAVGLGALVALAGPLGRSGPLRAQAPAMAMAMAIVALIAGLTLGAVRAAGIDAGSLDVPAGSAGSVAGWVVAVPDRDDGEVRVEVETADGRVEVRAPEPVPDIPVGSGVEASGVVREPVEFEAGRLERAGIGAIVMAGTIEPTGQRRGGVAGVLDSIRTRSEKALERGAPTAESALLRGFVLGQDEWIPDATEDAFRRSGLTHLLAVSGQNVLLLSILVIAALAVLGASLRDRLLIAALLIAIYVPVAGAGPSILRAGVMGIAGLAAALANRPASRANAVAIAALVTLALDPRAIADVGWQLSFAAVIGIMLLARPLRDLFVASDRRRGRLRTAIAEGAAVTIAATLATAPLMAASFEAVSVTSLAANLLVLPAVAPVMWLGMAAATLGQFELAPVEPLVWLAAHLAAYIEQVAAWCAAPGWAELEIDAPGILALVASYALVALALVPLLAIARRRRGLRPAGRRRSGFAAGPGTGSIAGAGRWSRIAATGPLIALAGLALVWPAGESGGRKPPIGRVALTVSVLDVGQGDAILLEPERADPVLIDTGPPGGGVAEALDARGIDRLGAVVLTHADSDHAGELAALGARIELGRIVRGAPGRLVRRAAASSGAAELEMTRGEVLRAGPARLEALWPPAELVDRTPGEGAPVALDERNGLSLVTVLRWRGFAMLLPGDAEAEQVPIDPGPLDAIKLAHHGSEDAGLDELLARSSPELAVISVGAENPYGHPTEATLGALGDAGAETLRTDLDGDVEIEIGRRGWRVAA